METNLREMLIFSEYYYNVQQNLFAVFFGYLKEFNKSVS